MRLIMIAFMITCSTLTPAGSNSLADHRAVHHQARAFMDKVVEGDIKDAYHSLSGYLGVDAKPYKQSADEAANYFSQVIGKVGPAIGHSHIASASIGDDFYREAWLQKFGAAAIVWHLTFYQPASGWKLVGVRYSTEVDDLYQPAK